MFTLEKSEIICISSVKSLRFVIEYAINDGRLLTEKVMCIPLQCLRFENFRLLSLHDSSPLCRYSNLLPDTE